MAIAAVAAIAALRGSDRGGRTASRVAPTVSAGDRTSFERALTGAVDPAYAADSAGAESAAYRAWPSSPASLGDRILAIIAGSPGTAAAADTVRGGGDAAPALARAQARLARAQARLDGAQARLEGVQDALDETGGQPEQAHEELLAQAQARIEQAQAYLDEARASLEEVRAGRRSADSASGADKGVVSGRPPQIAG
jgi:hypothetical protein